jgi:hypothetical protein
MNRGRSLVMAISLLLGPTLAPSVPGLSLPAAEAEDAYPTLGERLFRVEWVGGASAPDQFRIVGYVYNDYGEDAVNVQLRISEVDASGRTVGIVMKPVGNTVPASGRTSFDVRVPGTTSNYRVAVESFDFMSDPWTTETTEQLLADAGFEQKIADSPEKLANLQQLTPARKLVPQERDGQLYYVYADPALCKCMYVGTAAQFERARQQQLESDQLVAFQDHLSVPILWDLWAPWPWF